MSSGQLESSPILNSAKKKSNLRVLQCVLSTGVFLYSALLPKNVMLFCIQMSFSWVARSLSVFVPEIGHSVIGIVFFFAINVKLRCLTGREGPRLISHQIRSVGTFEWGL